MDKLLRKADTAKILGVSVTTLWRLQSDPEFPKARQVRQNGISGFLESEITAYLKSRPQVDESVGRQRVSKALAARGIEVEVTGAAEAGDGRG